ncbi:MAG: FHA domain-containing protein [Myxococcota bacterium]
MANLILEVEHKGERAVRVFDASQDRRVIIGRAPNCDLVIESAHLSRKHAMLLCTGAGWLLQDLGSTNGVLLNGKRVANSRPLQPGDVISMSGEIRLHFVGGEVPERLVKPVNLVVDLEQGAARLGEQDLPLSAAELIWFAFLAVHRSQSEGWVVAGTDGHAALRAFAASLLDRPWARQMKTRPLIDLAHGEEVDDEDLKNLRGKTAQKLKAFCTGSRAWMAGLLVPEVSGRNLQRLPLPPSAYRLIGLP